MFWIIVLLLLLSSLYYKVCHEPLQYWKRKKVKQRPWPIPLLGDFFPAVAKLETFSGIMNKIYNECKGRYYGMYQLQYPVLVIKDLDLIKQITVKDFEYFMDHRSFLPETNEPLVGKNLFSLTGNHWRHMRTTLSPAFTSSKMRSMCLLMNECSEQLTKFYLEKNKDEIVLEMKDIFTRYANDVIATCAFGTQVDSIKERDNEFYLMGKDSTDFTSLLRNIKFLMFFLSPTITKLINLHMFSDEVTSFFANLVKNTLKMREEQNSVRPDMIHLLMEARKGRLVHEDEHVQQDTGFFTVEESNIGKFRRTQKFEITDNDIAAQAFLFFFAGFETTSTVLSFMSHELAINPGIQEKLIAEVDEIRRACKGNITYEDLNKMKYMDMVISETLRKWPPALAVDRVCTKPYTIKPVKPEEHAVELSYGDMVWIPITALHHDPQYFPNPNKFDPERFSDENKHNINQCSYLPFGIGPRNCLGLRFALLQIKVVYYNILSHFKITVVEKTQIPIQILKGQLNMIVKNGNWVGFKRRIDQE